VRFVLDDGLGGTSSPATKTATVVAVNDAPTLTATPSSPTYTENGAAVPLFSGTSVSTVEVGQKITQLTLTVSNVTDGASETLAVDGSDVALTDGTSLATPGPAGVKVTVSVASGTATVTIDSTAGLSTTAAEGLINVLSYRNDSDNPTGSPRAVALTSITDDGGADNGGQDTTALSAASTVTVVAVNDAPVNHLPPDQTTDEDTPLVFSGGSGNAITVSDADAGGGELKATLTAAHGTVKLGGSSGVTVSGDGTALVTLTGRVTDVNAALDGLTFAPDADFNGTAGLQILTDDQGNSGSGGARTNSGSVTITVNAVNDAPAFDLACGATVAEDAGPTSIGGFASNFRPGPATAADESTQTLAGYTVTVIGTTSTLTFSSAPAIDASGTLTFTTAPDANGTATIQVTAADSGGATSSPLAFTIAVNAANDAPTFDLAGDVTVDEDAGARSVSGFASNFQPGPAAATDESAQTLTGYAVTVTGTTGTLAFVSAPAIDAGGVLTFEAAADTFGTATVQVTATDSGGATSDPQAFTIAVNPVADTPSVAGAATDEDTRTTGGVVVTRSPADGDGVGYFRVANVQPGTVYRAAGVTPGADGYLGAFGPGGTATLQFMPDPDFFGTGSFDVQAATAASAGGLGGGAVAALVTVTPVADTPTATDATTDEDALTTSGLVVTRGAADGAEVTHFQVTGITGGALFLADGTTAVNEGDFVAFDSGGTAQLRFAPGADQNDATGAFGFSVQSSTGASAAGLGGSVVPVAVHVNPVDDAPTVTLAKSAVSVPQDGGPAARAHFASFSPGGGPDEAAQTPAYHVAAANPALFSVQPAIGASGRLAFTPAPGASGTTAVFVTVTDSGGATSSRAQKFTINVVAAVKVPPVTRPPAPLPAARALIAVGSGAGGPGRVRVLDAVSGVVLSEFVPFGGFAGGVAVAVGDVDGDSRPDVIVATATGAAHVKVFSAAGAEVMSFLAFPGFDGGLSVAAGDVDKDGRADVVVGTATGSSHVKVFSGASGAEIRSFLAFDGFAGGVRVAAGDVDGDGAADVAAVAGPGGNGHVKVFGAGTGQLLTSFLGYEGYLGEINLAVADVTGDGPAEVITVAQNPMAGAHVKAFTARAEVVRSFFAPTGAGSAPGFTRMMGAAPTAGAPSVGAADVTGDPVADILLGTPPGTGADRLLVADGATGATLRDQLAFDPLSIFGVYVGG
jgi:hypothetical protein